MITEIHKIIKNKLIQQSAIYLSSEIINKSIPFFLLPILTRYLTPADYGIITTFTAIVAILGVFTGVNVHGAVNVAYFKVEYNLLQVYIYNALLILCISSILVFLFVLVLGNPLSHYTSIAKEWLLIAVIIAVSQFITLINLVLWQAEQNAFAYGIYQIAQTILNFGLTVLLIVEYNMKWEGQLLSISISTIIFALLSIYFINKRGYIKPIYRRKDIKNLLQFGIPLIPHSLAGWLKTGADRILLTVLIGTTATGIYSVGYQIGMIIGIIASAFNRAYSPYLFNKLKNVTPLEKVRLVKYTYVYFICIIMLAALLGVISPWFFTFLIGNEFQSSVPLVIWIAIGYAFDGMYYMVVNYIFYENKTTFLALITFSTSIFHIILSFILIKLFGEIGPAYATTFSYLAAFLLTWILSKRAYPMPWFGFPYIKS